MIDRDDPSATAEQYPANEAESPRKQTRGGSKQSSRKARSSSEPVDDGPSLKFRPDRKPVAPPEPSLGAMAVSKPEPVAKEPTQPETVEPSEPKGEVQGAVARSETALAKAEQPQSREVTQPSEAPPPGRGKNSKRNIADKIEGKKQIKIVEVAKPAGPATFKPRHRAMVVAFLILFLVPFCLAAFYLFTRATDQYGSTVGFTVRTTESGPVIPELGFDTVFGGSGSADADIIFEYIQSRSIVEQIGENFDFEAHYAAPYETDPVFALQPGADLETLTSYWNRITRISYEQATGLMQVRVQAFDPETAKVSSRCHRSRERGYHQHTQ